MRWRNKRTRQIIQRGFDAEVASVSTVSATAHRRRLASCLRAIPGEEGQRRAKRSRGAEERRTKSRPLKKALWEG